MYYALRKHTRTGWALQWSSGGSKQRSRFFGLLNLVDTYSLRSRLASSSASALSTLWRGAVGGLEVTAVTRMGRDSLFFTTHVKLRNIGAAPLTDVYCKSVM
jgi:hypothetical protein